MKFGKLLKDLIEGNPQMSEQPLIRYKELKKHLKSIKKHTGAPNDGLLQAQAAAATAAATAAALQQQQEQQYEEQPEQQQQPETQPGQELPPELSVDEQAFINMLNEDLLRFNRFFMDKEEEAVIKLQALADRIAGARGQSQETQELKAALVDFHGEMVLLLHWSLLNYAAVVKILKKHDKQSGLLLRAPFLANVLQQPFYSTSIMSRLVKMAEGHIESLVAQEAREDGGAEPAAAAAAAAADEEEQQPGSATQQAPPLSAAAAGPGPSSEAAAAEADRSNHASSLEAAAAAAVGAAAVTPPPAAAAAAAGGGGAGGGGGNDLESDTDTEEVLAGTAVCARTRVALQTWQQLCSNASTPSTVLPATSSQALVRALNVRQRWAQLVSMAPIMQQAGMEAPPADTAAAEGAAEAAAAGAAAAAAVPGSLLGAEQQGGGGQQPPAAVSDKQQQQQEAGVQVQVHERGRLAGEKLKALDQQLEAAGVAKKPRTGS